MCEFARLPKKVVQAPGKLSTEKAGCFWLFLMVSDGF